MPVNWKNYPDDWKHISKRVKDKADWTCEACGKPCRKSKESWESLEARLNNYWLTIFKGGKNRFTLTTAHLNHDTKDNRSENLKAFCSVCHLKYDAAYHASNRKKKKNAMSA